MFKSRSGCERSLVQVPVGPFAFFFSPVPFVGSVWVRARAASSKGTVSSVPTWFRADSGTNLLKQGTIVTGRPFGSVAQWSECSHGRREVESGSGHVLFFSLVTYIESYSPDSIAHTEVLPKSTNFKIATEVYIVESYSLFSSDMNHDRSILI